jgi:ribosomal protein S18 acetylase RimI-like enzyme
LTFEEVREFLLETDNEFPTSLSAHVDIDAYAKKLSDFSDFSICRDGESIVGMISCYTNRPPIGYMSNACIKKQYQAQKVFSKLFHQLLINAKERGVLRFQLEVDANNYNARRIYEHYGFQELSVNSETRKSLMELNLTEFVQDTRSHRNNCKK